MSEISLSLPLYLYINSFTFKIFREDNYPTNHLKEKEGKAPV